MANKDDYLTEYRCFFETFAQTVNPHDQLPVKLASYKLVNNEVIGGIIDWTSQYLNTKGCPQSLVAPLTKIVIDEIRKSCKKQPLACGFIPSDNAYEPLKLMQTVMAKTNEVCLRYLDNSKLCSLPSPGPPEQITSVCAVRNSRRRMEDRHVIVHDLDTIFNKQEASPSSYFAVFDGHAGHYAAAYSSAHLHQFLAESKHYPSNPEQALIDAFMKTDALFLDKCKVENISGGTTAVCALLRPKEKTLYIAWVGDSQALIANQGKILQCVHPHKPSREDEKQRIEREGGVVLFWGIWRVNGQLAVSRAIGDYEYKPYVTAVPDVREIPLDGGEDFLILACDGLWDHLSESCAARAVYKMVFNNPDDTDSISQRLVQLAKEEGSTDNISVIVVFLREPSKIAADALWANRKGSTMDALDNANATNNPFANSNGSDILAQKEGFLLSLGDGFKHNGSDLSPSNEYAERPANGKRTADEFDDDDDFGPETDVDAVDDILLSPAIAAAKSLAEGIANNNPFDVDPFGDTEEKAAFEVESILQKQQSSEFDPIRSPREETPTPPVDSVHDTSGLVDNVAESGEDSEDEWNYFKGDTAGKDNIPASPLDKEVAQLTDSELDSDTMSQLNPNAAEFVPVSPKRTASPPMYPTLVNDSLISQSPRRATPNDMDLSVPNPKDFESEVKSRPSELTQQYSNGHEDEDGQKLSSQELMEKLLNGKSIEEIEFQPSPDKTNRRDEFHFGPNATPFSTPAKPLDQSEALSTKAVFGDESTASYLEGKGLDSSFAGSEDIQPLKEQDPMSTSFYENRDDDVNPFDLNKVQLLPENIDEFLEKPEPAKLEASFNDTISDLPEHNPLGAENKCLDADTNKSDQNEQIIECCETETIKLEKEVVDDVCIRPSLASPVQEFANPPHQFFETESNLINKEEQISEQTEKPSSLICDFSSASDDMFSKYSLPEAASAFVNILEDDSQSPVPGPEEEEDNCLKPTSPSLVCDVPSPTKDSCKFELNLQQELHSPMEDITSSIKDDPSSPVISTSPLTAEVTEPINKSLTEVQELDFLNTGLQRAQEIWNATQDFMNPVNLITENENESCPISSPKSVTNEQMDTESVATADINSFLDRSILSDVASPLSPTEQMLDNTIDIADVNSTLSRCVYPVEMMGTTVAVELKSDFIAPDYAVEVITTPSEESKGEDSSQKINEIEHFDPLATSVKQDEQQNEDLSSSPAGISIAAAAAVAVTAAAVGAAKASADKKTKPISKKPATSKSATSPTKSPVAKLSTTKSTPTRTNQVLASKSATANNTEKPSPVPAQRTVAMKALSKPKTTTTAPKLTEKKPLTNGDVKAAPRPSAPPRKPITATTTRTSTATKPPITKVGLTKTDSKTTTSARPATAPPKTTGLRSTTATTTLSKPRPTSLLSKTSTASTRTTTSSVSTTKSTAKPTTLTASPRSTTSTLSKPRPATAPARPKPPVTKSIPKAPDAEKEMKETANKQLTASRTSTLSKTTGSIMGKTGTTTTVRKIETKAPRMSVTKTTTTTKSTVGIKKPAELVRLAPSKIKTTSTVTKKTTKSEQNGILTQVHEITTINVSDDNIEEPQLVKDLSPVDNNLIIDNSQLMETNIAD